MKKKLLLIASIMLIIGCTPNTYIKYKISARKDPFHTINYQVKTYALSFNDEAEDVIIDKNLLFLVSQSLENRGWVNTDPSEAEYVFSVKYSMDSEQHSGTNSVPRTTKTYDYRTQKTTTHVTQQQYSYNNTVHERKIIITAESGSDSTEIWSAECVSKGKTQDILWAAKYMVPRAISVFPQEGMWEATDKTNTK